MAAPHTTATPTDAQLVDDVADRLSRPKADGVDSFTLHAPLELLARTALLPLVEPEAREAARDRLQWLGSTYAAAGAEVPEPPTRAFDGPEAATRHLRAAIAAGELDDADAAASWLADRATADEVAALLADEVVPRLAAAGHGSILLYLLPRCAPRSRGAARALRGLVRELARQPDWTLRWFRDRPLDPGPGVDLLEALRAPRSPGDPGSSFVYPTMSLVESSGLAEEVLDGPTRATPLPEATRSLLRLASAAMVQDDPAAGPYGWSHCLTMPQAVLGLARTGAAEPAAAVAVAATFVLGFRATLGAVAVDPSRVPDPVGPALDALEGPPAEAAAGAFHATVEERPAVVARLASWAAAHEDAHLAKYTLACLDAAHDDPRAVGLHLAAAAHLNAWWRSHPDDAG